jgi:hypothetical protein
MMILVNHPGTDTNVSDYERGRFVATDGGELAPLATTIHLGVIMREKVPNTSAAWKL